MKLLNHSLFYLGVPIFVVITIWSFVFYTNMLAEIYDSIDDGLDNYKLLIIQKTKKDTTILSRSEFEEGNYAIRKISEGTALQVKDIYSDTLMYMLNEEEMEPVRMLTTAFARNERYYKLKVIASMVEEDDQIDNLTQMSIILYFLLLLSIIFINNFALKGLWKPFYKLLERLKNFRVDRESETCEIETNIDEFQELQSATNMLIEYNRGIYSRQKQFIENAAHELHTPLAVIINKLELLLEDEGLTEESAKVIGEVMGTSHQLVHYNQALLLLSRIENKQFFDNQEVELLDIVEKTVTGFKDYIEYQELEVVYERRERLTVDMDPQLATILVTNLIKNAIFHNFHSGVIRISTISTELTVANTSKVNALDESKIYHRYYRAHNSSARKGTGLGLPITKAICDLYGFRITYRYEGSLHNFSVLAE